MLAITYRRVSTEEQSRHGYSLAAQAEACEKIAREHGATQVLPISDDGVSGSVLDRPGLRQARDLIRSGQVQLFVCLDPDRLARNLSHQLLLTEEIERHHVKLIFVNFDWEDTPEGRLFYALRGAVAEYEKEKIRERTIRGKLAKAKQGKLTHNPQTYGYRYDPQQSTLVVQPDEAAVVRQIYSWYIDGSAGFQKIADRLNAAGISSPRGSTWHKMTVKRILANETYTGTLHLNQTDAGGVKYNRYQKGPKARRKLRPPDEWIPISVPPIISSERYRSAQQRRERNRRQAPTQSTPYLLSGLLCCARCGSSFRGSRTQGRNGKVYRYYICNGRSPSLPGDPSCTLPSPQADALEQKVWGLVLGWLTSHTRIEQSRTQSDPAPHRGIGDLENALRQIGDERSRLLRLLTQGLITDAEAEHELIRLRERALELERERVAKLRPTRPSPPQTPLREWQTRVHAYLTGLPPSRRREIVQRAVSRIVVGDKTLRIRPRLRRCTTDADCQKEPGSGKYFAHGHRTARGRSEIPGGGR